MNIYAIHMEFVEWVVENITDDDSTKVYLMGDYNLPGVHFENNNIGMLYFGQLCQYRF